MRTQFKVHWASVAEDDLKNIILYIAENSPTNARLCLQKIKEAAASLTMLSERGRVVPELEDQGVFLYRELIVSPWRIIYRISEQKVYVLSVMDSRQNAEDILLKKLTK